MRSSRIFHEATPDPLIFNNFVSETPLSMESATCLMDEKTRAGILRYFLSLSLSEYYAFLLVPVASNDYFCVIFCILQAADISGSGGRRKEGCIQWVEIDFETPIRVNEVQALSLSIDCGTYHPC